MEWLPAGLPSSLKPIWSIETEGPGLGGIAATRDFVFYSGRALRDTTDFFCCVKATDGSPVWSFNYPAPGALDYGNSPRATPLIHQGKVFVQGAMGHLSCLDLKSGGPMWEMNLKEEFEVKEDLKWGFCASPLIVEDKLIVMPGAPDAGMVALDPTKGKILWKSPGKAPGYGSLAQGNFSGKTQIVGHDADSLGGWDPTTGKRLWRLAPPVANDFNVPTPIVHGDGVLISTENNGTRYLKVRPDGSVNPQPAAVFRKLAPDTHTPVKAGDRLLGISKRLFCLDASTLKPLWELTDPAFGRYCALVATENRALVISLDGELLLISTQDNPGRVLAKSQIFPGEKGLYSHPAFVGSRMYARGGGNLACFSLTGG